MINVKTRFLLYLPLLIIFIPFDKNGIVNTTPQNK